MSDLMTVSMEGGGHTTGENLKFTWHVHEYSEKELTLKIDYEEPLQVSRHPESDQV